MSDKKTNLSLFPTEKNIDATAFLEIAKEWDLKEIIVMGFDDKGNFLWGGNEADLRTTSLILTCATNQLNLLAGKL